MKKRNELLDISKGLAILLVVLGHSIQYGSGRIYLEQTLFFENFLFKLIYSFHMPLFMLISGYLFRLSVTKYSNKINIKKRVNTLIIPIFAWSVVSFFISYPKLQNLEILNLIKSFISTFVYNLWFLWAIFYCSIVIILVKKFFYDNILIYILLFCLTFIIPDILNFKMYTFMYQFFTVGYLFCKYKDNYKKFINDNKFKLLLINFTIYLILILFFEKESYIYTSGYCILKDNSIKQFGIDIYRMVIGFIGSSVIILSVDLFFVNLSKRINNILIFLGKNSLGIYIISGYIFRFLPNIMQKLNTINYLYMLIETVVILGISLLITLLIQKSKFMNNLLLGGRQVTNKQ